MTQKERPILFSAPMVVAILAGRKTQTRRLVKPQPEWQAPRQLCATTPEGWQTLDGHSGLWSHDADPDMDVRRCPFGAPGDRLWVRETWAAVYDCPFLPCCEDGEGTHRRVVYRATDAGGVDGFCRSFEDDRPAVWHPSIFMRRAASRITLEVTEVRVERLQDISDADAKAEGVMPYEGLGPDQRVPGPGFNRALLADQPHRLPFADLWCSINGTDSWDANPWVWAISFRRKVS